MNTELQYWISLFLIIGGSKMLGVVLGYKLGYFNGFRRGTNIKSISVDFNYYDEVSDKILDEEELT